MCGDETRDRRGLGPMMADTDNTIIRRLELELEKAEHGLADAL
jgi:hypothetical protein